MQSSVGTSQTCPKTVDFSRYQESELIGTQDATRARTKTWCHFGKLLYCDMTNASMVSALINALMVSVEPLCFFVILLQQFAQLLVLRAVWSDYRHWKQEA